MAARTIIKLIILGIITVIALVAVFCGKFAYSKKRQKTEQQSFQLMIRIRTICFVLMLILVLICFII